MLVLKEEEKRGVDHFGVGGGALTACGGASTGLGDSHFTLSPQVSEQPQDLRGMPVVFLSCDTLDTMEATL